MVTCTNLPFSDVCSTVSCWALILSVILPPTHALAFDLSLICTHHSNPKFSLPVHLHSADEHLSLPVPCLSLPTLASLPYLSSFPSEQCLLLKRPAGSRKLLCSPRYSSSSKRPRAQRKQTLNTQQDISSPSNTPSSSEECFVNSAQEMLRLDIKRHQPRHFSRMSDKDIKKVVVFPQDDQCQNQHQRRTTRKLRRTDLDQLLCELSSHQLGDVNWSSFMDAFWDKDDDKEDSGSNESNTASDIDASGTKKSKTNNLSSKKDSVTADDVWEDSISCAVQDNELFQFGATPLDQQSCYSLTLESLAHLADSDNSNSPTTLVCILDSSAYSESKTHSSQRSAHSLSNTKSNNANVNFSKTMNKNGKMPTTPRPSQMTALQKPSAIFKTCEMNEMTVHETMKSHANGQAATTNSKSKQSIWKQFPAEKDSIHRRGMQSPAQRFMQRFESFRLARFIHEATILARDDSMKGKLVMVLMSTICSVIVGMIGALLFVVALKVRALQSRRQPEGIPPRHQTGVPPQIRESGYKRVIPRGILDSFGVRTVLRTSTTAMVTTAVAESNLVGLSKASKLCYAGDVNGMEGGLEDMFTRRDVRRQRQQTRTSHLFTHARVSQGQDEVAVEQDFLDDEGDNGAGWGVLLEDEEEEMTASDLQRITAAIMNATRRGSYRRVSHSRQGQGQGQLDSSMIDSSMMSGALLSTSMGSQSRECEEEKQRMCGCGDGGSHGEEKEKLPFANANAQTMCSICLSEYEVGDQVRTLPCYHQYHTSCIDPWLLTVASLCPICKRDLLPGSTA